MVLFRCVNGKNYRVENLPLEEIQPTFKEWMDEAEFCSRGGVFGMREYVFKGKEAAFLVEMATMENDKWLFSPIYMGKRMIDIRIGTVSPLVKVNWVQAAVFKEISNYNVLSLVVMEMVFYW